MQAEGTMVPGAAKLPSAQALDVSRRGPEQLWRPWPQGSAWPGAAGTDVEKVVVSQRLGGRRKEVALPADGEGDNLQ